MCDHCDQPGRTYLCPCKQVAFCSQQCAELAWDAYHADACTFTQLVEAKASKSMQTLSDLLQDASAPAAKFSKAFSAAYPPSNYQYITQHYDRCVKPLMKLDSRGDVAITTFSSIQRLWRDYFGPWTGARMAVLKLPPGFGKTAMGHLLFANYKYEAVQVSDIINNTPDLVTQPRIPIWVTRPTLAHQVSDDLWAQDDRNPAELKQKIRDNGGLVAERGTQFNRNDLVMNYTQFENLLQGRNAAGRRLWAGQGLTGIQKPVISSMETYTGVPTAYRREGGQWVRGNAPHNLDSTTELRNIKLVFSDPKIELAVGALEKIRKMMAADFSPILRQWQRFKWTEGGRQFSIPTTLKKAIKNIASIESDERETLTLIFRWKSRDPERIPTFALWGRWVVEGFNPFKAYKRFSTLYKGVLDATAIGEEPVDSLERGWKLSTTVRGVTATAPKGRQVTSWVPSDKSEIDYTPLDRLMIVIDEAHNIFESELIRTALKDSRNVVVVNMSASLDLFTELRLLDNGLPRLPNPSPDALGPANGFPTDIPILTEDIQTYDELKRVLTPKYFDATTNDFTKAFKDLKNTFKGVISVANISEMRDLFAEAVYPRDQRINVKLSTEHATFVRDMILGRLEAEQERELKAGEEPKSRRSIMRQLLHPTMNAIALSTRQLDDRYNLASAAFAEHAATVAGTLIYDETPVFPAAAPLLRLLHKLDVKEMQETGDVTKRLIYSSTKDHDFGIIPTATSMQAAGYEWLPIELQRPDVARLSETKRRQLRKDRKLGVKVNTQLRKVKMVENSPFSSGALHSDNVDEELQPAHERKQFVVLSEALLNRVLIAASLEPTLGSLTQDILDEDRPTLKTVYKFHSNKGQFRKAPPDVDIFEVFATDDAERKEFVEELLETVAGKRLYLWPGYQEEMEEWSMFREEGPMSVLLNNRDPQPFFFIRTQRSIVKLGAEIDELNITDVERKTRLLWPQDGFNPAKKPQTHDFKVMFGWLRPASELGDDVKKDAQDTILDLVNSIENIRGVDVRFILLAEGFLEGINIRGATEVIEAESAVTHGSSVQRRGRAIRRCGHEGLPFEQWRVGFHTLVHTLPSNDMRIPISSLAEDDEDWPLDADDMTPQDRKFAFRQLEAISSIGAQPVDWKKVPTKKARTPILDSETTLELYQVVRVLNEDPRISVIRLLGEQVMETWAADSGHNQLRTETTAQVQLNTNYILRKTGIMKLRDKTSRRLSQHMDPDSTKYKKIQARLAYVDDLLELLKTEEPIIYRHIAARDRDKTLYLSRKKRITLVTRNFAHLSPVKLLEWLVRYKYAVWGTVIDPAEASAQLSEGDEIEEAESVLVGAGIEAIGASDEEQEAIERATMLNVYRILATLGISWNEGTTLALWPDAEEVDSLALQVVAAAVPLPSKSIKRISSTTQQLRKNERVILNSLFADDGTGKRSLPLKRWVKRAIVNIHRYGMLNWYRAAGLLAHVLRVNVNDPYWATNAGGPRSTRGLTESQLTKASTLVGALFRLASAPQLNTYLAELTRLGLASIQSLGQKAAVILASARWSDEIRIRQTAADLKKGAQGTKPMALPLVELSAILTHIQSTGINVPLHLSALLEPLSRPRPRTVNRVTSYPRTLEELEQQLRKKPPALTTVDGADATKLLQFYVQTGRDLNAAWEQLKPNLAKRNTIMRAIGLAIPDNVDDENVDQQIEQLVGASLQQIGEQWSDAAPYPAAIITDALLRAYRVKYFVPKSGKPAAQKEAITSFMKEATTRLEVKTDAKREFLRKQKFVKKAEELQHLQDRSTRITGFRSAQRVVNRLGVGVGIEKSQAAKLTDVIPVGSSVAVEELQEEQVDGSLVREGSLLVRIDEEKALTHRIPGGLLQPLSEGQDRVTLLPQMYIDELVIYWGTQRLEGDFVEELLLVLLYFRGTERLQQLSEELAHPRNRDLLQTLLTNRPAPSLLKLMRFAAVGNTDNGIAILGQHTRLTAEFIDEFEDKAHSDLDTRLRRFCSDCSLDDIKHLMIDPSHPSYQLYPYYTQVEWDAHEATLKKSPWDDKLASQRRQNANVLRMAVILYTARDTEDRPYGSYKEHVEGLRKRVASFNITRVHEKIPNQTKVTQTDKQTKQQVPAVVVVAWAHREAVEELRAAFIAAYTQ